jgi:hypothetical protein
MKIFIRFMILLITPITGCAANDVPPSTTAQPAKNMQLSTNVQYTDKRQLVNLHGLEAKEKLIRLQVMSNGCTKAKSFKLNWQKDNLSIQRLKQDYCRRTPHKIWLEFEIPTEIKAFSVANKFVH